MTTAKDEIDYTTLPEHLRPEVTDRGFGHLPPLPNEYGGPEDICVRESSNAEYAGIWLDVTAMDTEGKPVQVTANITAEVAWQLAEQLAFTVATHYHGDQRRAVFGKTRLAIDLPGDA